MCVYALIASNRTFIDVMEENEVKKNSKFKNSLEQRLELIRVTLWAVSMMFVKHQKLNLHRENEKL